jgi:hypothetical protein
MLGFADNNIRLKSLTKTQPSKLMTRVRFPSPAPIFSPSQVGLSPASLAEFGRYLFLSGTETEG